MTNIFADAQHIFPVLSTWLNNKNATPLTMAFSTDEQAINLSDVNAYQAWIDKQCQGKIGHGGYFEKRDVYAQSGVFRGNEKARNIHLGIDLWTAAETPIYAPLDGTVHSFSNLLDTGNYGGVIILEHQINQQTCYTLYGHINFESINHAVGDNIKAGTQLASLGAHEKNGGWPPHLHLQAMLSMEKHVGDYPGVCFEDEIVHYKQNCLDPSMLIFGK
jgi:murein DD-endopeptidase MepM/ murein hydrolase activator NlpD